jgi:DHA1 family multidrug resistance protein-like MFS transporter
VTEWRPRAYVIAVSQFLSSVAFSCSLSFVPLFVQTLGVTGLDRIALWSGFLDTASGIAMALSSPVWGLISDRYGRKPIVLRGMWGCTLVFGAVLLARDVQHLLLIFLLKGLVSGIRPAATSLMASVTPDQNRGNTFGFLELAASGGMALGPVVGGIVAQLYGHRFTYVLSSLLFASAGSLVTILVREEYRAPAPAKTSTGVKAASILGGLKGSGQMGLVLLIIFLVRSGRTVLKPVLPLLVQSLEAGEGRVAISTGVVVGVTQLFTAMAAVRMGSVGDRIGHKTTATISTLLASVLCLLQSMAQDTPQLIVVRAGLGMCLGGVLPSTNALLALSVPSERLGMVYGLLATVYAAGNLLGPLLGAGITAALGLSQPFVLSSVLLTVAGLIVWARIREGAAVNFS